MTGRKLFKKMWKMSNYLTVTFSKKFLSLQTMTSLLLLFIFLALTYFKICHYNSCLDLHFLAFSSLFSHTFKQSVKFNLKLVPKYRFLIRICNISLKCLLSAKNSPIFIRQFRTAKKSYFLVVILFWRRLYSAF